MTSGTTVHPGLARTIVWKQDCATILLDYELVISLDIAQVRKQHGENYEKLRLMFDGTHFYYMPAGEPAVKVNPQKSC